MAVCGRGLRNWKSWLLVRCWVAGKLRVGGGSCSLTDILSEIVCCCPAQAHSYFSRSSVPADGQCKLSAGRAELQRSGRSRGWSATELSKLPGVMADPSSPTPDGPQPGPQGPNMGHLLCSAGPRMTRRQDNPAGPACDGPRGAERSRPGRLDSGSADDASGTCAGCPVKEWNLPPTPSKNGTCRRPHGMTCSPSLQSGSHICGWCAWLRMSLARFPLGDPSWCALQVSNTP